MVRRSERGGWSAALVGRRRVDRSRDRGPFRAGVPAAPAGPPPPSGAPLGSAWGSGATEGSSPAWGSSTAWEAAAPAPHRGNGVRAGIIVAAVLGVLALVVIGVIGVAAMRFAEFDTDAFTVDPPTTVTTRVEARIGDRLTGTIPRNGAFEASFTVERPARISFDVRGEDSFDGMVEVVGPDGVSLGSNDDRGPGARGGGSSLDPYLELDLESGRHTVIVEGWAGEGGSFELRID